MHYKDLCEEIYREWRHYPGHFSDFDSDFNLFSLPEPYFPLRDGGNEIVVLNNNPGGVLDFQLHSAILREVGDLETYQDVSRRLQDKYTGEDRVISSAAHARNERVKDVADALGHGGIENVETFYLHSSSFDKKRFLKQYRTHPMVVAYTDALRAYLARRPVVIIAAVASSESLTSRTIAASEWLCFQAGIAGFEIAKAKREAITKKSHKTTSGVFRYGDKTLICTMGSNNIPKDAGNVISKGA